MKKYMTLLLAGVMALSLTACGQSQPEPRRFELSDAQMLADAGVFSEELEELDADVAFALYHLGDYGLDRADLTDAAVLRSAGATCEECAVLRFEVDSWKEKTSQAVDALEEYLDGQINANENYRPDEIPKLEQALLEARGDRVILVVADDAEQAKTLLEIE